MNTFFFVTAMVFGWASTSFAAKCLYGVDSKSVQIGWTAFKTSQKVGVNGSFPQATIRGDLSKNAEFKDFLSQIEAEIKISGPDQFHTGNPGRDQTIFEHFFKHLSKSGKVTGMIKKVKGDAKGGEFSLSLSMNNKTQAIPMNYTRDEASGAFEAKGTIDVIQFGLGKALHDLHKTCEALHQGSDGVSKTWPVVDIKLSANISEKCGS